MSPTRCPKRCPPISRPGHPADDDGGGADDAAPDPLGEEALETHRDGNGHHPDEERGEGRRLERLVVGQIRQRAYEPVPLDEEPGRVVVEVRVTLGGGVRAPEHRGQADPEADGRPHSDPGPPAFRVPPPVAHDRTHYVHIGVGRWTVWGGKWGDDRDR